MKKLKKLFKWIWQQLKDPINLVIYICVVVIFYLPSILGYLLALITKTPWHTTWATAYLLFWAGPLTPAIPLQITITLGIRKLLKIKRSSKMFKAINYRIQRTGNLNDVYFVDEAGPGNGRHKYFIMKAGEHPDTHEPLAILAFQNGPRKEETSVHGILDQDLLEITRHRLQCFQEGEYRTRENACQLTHVEEALMWANKRTCDRDERGVLGTMNK